MHRSHVLFLTFYLCTFCMRMTRYSYFSSLVLISQCSSISPLLLPGGNTTKGHGSSSSSTTSIIAINLFSLHSMHDKKFDDIDQLLQCISREKCIKHIHKHYFLPYFFYNQYRKMRITFWVKINIFWLCIDFSKHIQIYLFSQTKYAIDSVIKNCYCRRIFISERLGSMLYPTTGLYHRKPKPGVGL